ncbi:MAG: hypothetical protein ACPIB1_07770 [Porticoccaceae bacterium]
MAEKASRDKGVDPVSTRLRHFMQIRNDVASVMAMANESISYTG